jgi:hypothetical protein
LANLPFDEEARALDHPRYCLLRAEESACVADYAEGIQQLMGNHCQPVIPRAIGKGKLFRERQLWGSHGLARTLRGGTVTPQVCGFDLDLE